MKTETAMTRNDKIALLLEKYPPVRENLIPILQEIQEAYGYLSKESIVRVAEYLKLASGKVYGVATFYNQFKFQPSGRWLIQLCRGTACHVKGSEKLLDLLHKELGIQPGGTTADGLFSLEITPCLGVCGLAPVICINGKIHSGVTREKVMEILNEFRKSAGEEA